MNKPSASFFSLAMERVRDAWSDISSNLLGQEELKLQPSLSDSDLKKLKDVIDQSLNASGGEVTARNTAACIGRAYMTLDKTGRERFFTLLATDYDVNDEIANQAILDYQHASANTNLAKLRHELRMALLAPRVKLLTLFNTLPEGIKFLIDMRAEIIAVDKEVNKKLGALEKDLKHLLASWFDVGFLKLKQITWDSPASLLEKLIEYEAVHEITDWNDLKNRLSEDRRLFAFFHPNLPREPLIFVQVALVKGLATNVQKLLDTDAPVISNLQADTAIFYSISNAQQGLVGISFGNFLIKRVVSEVKKELPQLKQFATLSPIPGFKRWLDAQLENASPDLFHEAEQVALTRLIFPTVSISPGINPLLGILKTSDWHTNRSISDAIQPILKRLCAVYLSTVHPVKNRLIDPVAHFHTSNGAIMQQLNWLGDTSTKGLAQSYGLMINYLYDLNSINENTEAYAVSHRAALSREMQQLLPDKHQKNAWQDH